MEEPSYLKISIPTTGDTVGSRVSMVKIVQVEGGVEREGAGEGPGEIEGNGSAEYSILFMMIHPMCYSFLFYSLILELAMENTEVPDTT